MSVCFAITIIFVLAGWGISAFLSYECARVNTPAYETVVCSFYDSKNSNSDCRYCVK